MVVNHDEIELEEGRAAGWRQDRRNGRSDHRSNLQVNQLESGSDGDSGSDNE